MGFMKNEHSDTIPNNVLVAFKDRGTTYILCKSGGLTPVLFATTGLKMAERPPHYHP